MKKVDIFSDINFSGYQHVNQMLHCQLLRCGINSMFLQRFYLNVPSVKRMLAMAIYGVRSKNEFSSGKLETSIRGVTNIPSLNFIMDIINYCLVRKHVKGNVAITFLPSKGLEKIFSMYDHVVYYCVHDSLMQKYSERNIDFEGRLISNCSLVFCDNTDVLNRIADNKQFFDVSEYTVDALLNIKNSGCKFFYVPPPVPNVFFECDDLVDVEFDYVYFGSLHDNIEYDVFSALDYQGFRVLIVTGEAFPFPLKNGVVKSATSNLYDLVGLISSARYILLPYKNSEFMNTVSPAKLYQSLATGKPVYTTNFYLSVKYNLCHMNNKGEIIKNITPCRIDGLLRYKSDMLMSKLSALVSAL